MYTFSYVKNSCLCSIEVGNSDILSCYRALGRGGRMAGVGSRNVVLPVPSLSTLWQELQLPSFPLVPWSLPIPSKICVGLLSLWQKSWRQVEIFLLHPSPDTLMGRAAHCPGLMVSCHLATPAVAETTSREGILKPAPNQHSGLMLHLPGYAISW